MNIISEIKDVVKWYIGVWREALGYDERIRHRKQKTREIDAVVIILVVSVIIGFMWII